MRERLHFLLLNVGHFMDHLFTLIFASVAALALSREWGLGYADLLKYATPGFFAFGVFAPIYHPVGLAIVVERWKNTGMRIAVNGVWGNLGVASAALITGYCIDHGGWRA